MVNGVVKYCTKRGSTIYACSFESDGANYKSVFAMIYANMEESYVFGPP